MKADLRNAEDIDGRFIDFKFYAMMVAGVRGHHAEKRRRRLAAQCAARGEQGRGHPGLSGLARTSQTHRRLVGAYQIRAGRGLLAGLHRQLAGLRQGINQSAAAKGAAACRPLPCELLP